MTEAGNPVDLISQWMERVGRAGLVLPNGWFGRPFDNMHRLTWVEQRQDRLFLELDDQLLLVLTRPQRCNAGATELTIEAAQIVFDWREYGSRSPHVETFAGGTVKLVVPGVL
jgi:hypothetical protein